jgi:hypothetical protein
MEQFRANLSYIRPCLKNQNSRASVAHACNPSYLGGTDHEDHGSKPARANSSRNPISKIPITKRAGRVVPGEGPEFKPHYHKKKIVFLHLKLPA